MVAIFIVASVVVSIMIFLGVKTWISELNDKHEMEDIMFKCTEIESKCNCGIAVFRPDPSEDRLYQRLVSRGMLRNNPLGGYSLADGCDMLWKNVPKIHVRPSGDYQDDDGVLAYDKDENGKLIPKIFEKDVIASKKGNANGNC